MSKLPTQQDEEKWAKDHKTLEAVLATRKRKRIHPEMGKESMTKQSFKDECDISKIVARSKAGIPAIITKNGSYLDNQDLDYQEHVNQIMETEENFMSLPSHIRKQFNNDPAEIITFLENPKNIQKAQEIGLINKPKITLQEQHYINKVKETKIQKEKDLKKEENTKKT